MVQKDKLVTFDDFQSLRENIGFHFTPKANIDSILDTGLKPKIGDNASGGLGKESIEKTFISYGLEGVLQLYNRLVNASHEQNIIDFKSNISHLPFIPESASAKNPTDKLSLLEGLEFTRQYMEDNVYFMLEAPVTQYENEVTQSDIDELNTLLSTATISGTDKTIKSEIKILTKQIDALFDSGVDKSDEKISSLVQRRRELSIQLRKITLQELDKKRGKLLNEHADPIMEQVDYNDDRILWYDQIAAPHNTHTRVIEDETGLHGVRITADRLKLFSTDGQTPADGLDFLNAALERVTPEDTIALSFDCMLLQKLNEYAGLVKEYKSQGLLTLLPETTYTINDKQKTLPARYVMDLSDLSKYPGLQDYMAELEEYFQNNNPKGSPIKLAQETASEQSDIAYINETAQAMKQDEKNLSPKAQEQEKSFQN